jgi:hypothetical protein
VTGTSPRIKAGFPMQTYIDEHFDSKYCYGANCGAFLLAYVKKVTVADISEIKMGQQAKKQE